MSYYDVLFAVILRIPSENGIDKVFLDKDNCFSYIEHTEGYSTILVGEILEEVLPVHNLVARIKYRDGVSDELDEEIYSELQKFIDKYGHHIESIQISEIKLMEALKYGY